MPIKSTISAASFLPPCDNLTQGSEPWSGCDNLPHDGTAKIICHGSGRDVSLRPACSARVVRLAHRLAHTVDGLVVQLSSDGKKL